MTTKKKIFTLLAWLQLVISILMAALMVWGYLTYRAPIGQFVKSIEATMLAGSSLLEGTRETIEARSAYIDETGKLLIALRKTLRVFSKVVKNQQTMVPQYAESLRSASSIAMSMSGVLHHTGNDLMIARVPTGINLRHGLPKFEYHYPFKNLAATLEQNSKEFDIIGTRIAVITDTIASDGQNVGTAMNALTNQSLKMVNETFLALFILKQGLPKALEDIQVVSDNLKNLSAHVHFLSYIGIVLLTFGLLMSGWCFLHSIGALMVVKSQAFEKPAAKINAAVHLSTK